MTLYILQDSPPLSQLRTAVSKLISSAASAFFPTVFSFCFLYQLSQYHNSFIHLLYPLVAQLRVTGVKQIQSRRRGTLFVQLLPGVFFFLSAASICTSKSHLSCHLGPKGVINDWRRFKLESMDQDNLPPAKRDLLRQMSSPNGPKDDSRSNLNRKVQANYQVSANYDVSDFLFFNVVEKKTKLTRFHIKI